MGYRITKLFFTETDGITCLEVMDDKGDRKDIISQNSHHSVPNKGNLIDLPEITAESLVFTAETKTKKEAPKKSNSDILKEFVEERLKAEPEWEKDIRKFEDTYSKLLPKWKGNFWVKKCYEKWVEKRKK